jgi:hypothetical protein
MGVTSLQARNITLPVNSPIIMHMRHAHPSEPKSALATAFLYVLCNLGDSDPITTATGRSLICFGLLVCLLTDSGRKPHILILFSYLMQPSHIDHL